ncbi:MAG: 2-dehydro-3-deoxy-D-gluconate 5-dehydrogenase KduD [Lachnospiraceae bacterium]|nr:2-dehydro-3-deoxy-D-gluconate 5-dehydrogenase KduD [Lachnospiraceae bacterium]
MIIMAQNFNLFSLEGKTALVTGANTGLGQGICAAYAAAGANVIGAARRSCQETAEKIAAYGGKFTEIIADLSDINVIPRIVEEADKAYGRVDILVNNAGIIKRCDAVDVTVEDWDSVIDINERMVFFLSQAFAKGWVADNKGGKIINIASMLSYQGGIRVPAYTASKSAVMGLTKALANEWAKHNINVNAIAPGYMATNNTQNLRRDEQRSEEILSRIPAGRWGTPEDIAGAAVFLASDAAAYIHGFTLAVDGGWLAR